MSDPQHGSQFADDDGVDVKKILTIGGIALATFALSALIAYLILRSDIKEVEARGLPAVPSEIGKDEIGIVDQVEFSQDTRLEEWRAAKHKRLAGYGWVDRDKGLVHIPVDKAMDQVVSQSAGAP
jgi:hypothetical protein